MPYLSTQRFAIVLSSLIAISSCTTTKTVDPGYYALARAKSQANVANTLGAGDLFRIDVTHEKALSGTFKLSPSGTFNYPYLGRIEAQGKTCSQIEEALTQGLKSGYLTDPAVSCAVLEHRSKRVFVLGEVRAPGPYPCASQLSIVDAVARAGGFREDADVARVNLNRILEDGRQVQVEVPFEQIVNGTVPDMILLPGDILNIAGPCIGCDLFRSDIDPLYQRLVSQQFKVPVTGELGPEDKLSIQVTHQPELSREYTVSADGSFTFSYLGRVPAAGKTCVELETLITQGLRDGYLTDPAVSCTVLEYNSHRVFVLGRVAKPGPYAYQTRSTIVEAIALAGGFAQGAEANRVSLRRVLPDGKQIQVEIPVKDIINGRQKNLLLLPGDVVNVPGSAIGLGEGS